ncbi:hypothetical protein [Leptospira alstonii]|uniref:Uncharacterized protein n=1 Tax=Leptospira alstonii serovar Sichuan str. 79601 TaxID=1218565 RepID=M6D8A8_9LEPT|nr:hypothetical protein [Leptospira alstonii]EMJ94800.1 hypothetical protein LEP1GSC194_3141 [Leptospira alstonii serovar Sichuan str. 79601]
MKTISLPVWKNPKICACGNAAELQEHFGYRTRVLNYYVACDECEKITIFYRTAVEAVDAWNRDELDTEE